MGNDILEIRAHVCEMLQANRVMLAAIAGQLRAGQVDASRDARWLLERVARTLNSHIDELEEHLRRLGGSEARSLRSYYTALTLSHTAALTLETDARSHGYSSTAAMARRHREEIAALLGSIRELLPLAVKEEIGRAEVAP
jgi:hypothetical protein